MIPRRLFLWSDRRGAVGAEFALLVPLFLLIVFGIIDVGRYMWSVNRAEKAAQMGVRYAVATEMIPGGLAGYSFSQTGSVPQGALIPESAFGGATCDASGCTCNTGATCPPLGTASAVAFDNIVDRIRFFYPEIEPSDVEVEYGYSGLGFAGDPNGPDVAPLVTVRLENLTFRPITFLVFGGTIGLPDFASTLSLEDGSFALSN